MPLRLLPAWAHDLPVCFPARPCVEYSPYEADVINLTSGLTPASQAIAVVCFTVLGVALVLIASGLRSRSSRPGPSLWVVAVSTALALVGIVVAAVIDLRFSAISAIYGMDGPGGDDLLGSWSVVGLAGDAMAAAGFGGVVTTATVAVLRLRNAASSGRERTT